MARARTGSVVRLPSGRWSIGVTLAAGKRWWKTLAPGTSKAMAYEKARVLAERGPEAFAAGVTESKAELAQASIASMTRRDLEQLVEHLDRRVQAGELAPKTVQNVWGLLGKPTVRKPRLKCRRRESNPRPVAYETTALTV
jgi:hypothetical protein